MINFEGVKNKYRIVSDDALGYEVQIKRPFIPFWCQCWDKSGGYVINTHSSIERAKDFIIRHKNKFVLFCDDDGV